MTEIRHAQAATSGPNSFAVPAKFGAVGVVNTLVDSVVYLGLTQGAHLSAVSANSASYSCGIICSFVLNRSWTFKGSHRRPLMIQSMLFLLVNLGGLALSNLVIWSVVGYVGVLPAKAVVLVITFVWNYALNRLVVFPHSKGSDLKTGEASAEPGSHPPSHIFGSRP